MKKTVVLVICMMLMAGVLAGCQETPEESIIKYREEEQYAAPPVEEQVNGEVFEKIPGHISERIVEYNGKVILNIDADVVFPERERWPVYRVRLHRLTYGEAEKYITALVGDAPLKQENKALTKEDYMRMIRDYQAAIAEIRGGSDAYEGTIEEFEEKIAEAKQLMAGAPSEADYESFKFDKSKKNERVNSIEVFADIREEANPIFTMSDDPYGSWFTYADTGRKGMEGSRGCDDYTDIFYSVDTVTKVIQKDEQTAVKEAEEFLRQIGIQGMTPEGTVLPFGYETKDLLTYDYCAHGIVFTRAYNDIPRAYLGDDSTKYIVDAENEKGEIEQYTLHADNEVLIVMVDDEGPVQLRWTAPDEITEIENENVKLVDFDRVCGAFQDALKLNYAYIPQNEQILTPEEFADLPPVELNIREIRLSYARIRIPNNYQEYRVVPAWVLYDGNGEAVLAINATDMSTVS